MTETQGVLLLALSFIAVLFIGYLVAKIKEYRIKKEPRKPLVTNRYLLDD